MIACHILKVRCSWSEGDFLDPTRRIVPDVGFQGGKEVEALTRIVHHGTHGAYENLIYKQADIILVAREPSEDERNLAAEENVVLDGQPIARDAFVFLVHVDNPVQSLSLEQLRAIYTGRITSWAEVGGIEAEIHTYQRNPNSGSQELMEKLVMKGEAMLDSPDMILETMMGPINAIRDDPLGIGYSVYFYAAHIYPDENVRLLALDGIGPEKPTIADRSYPLATDVYAVLRVDTPSSSLARVLQDWLLTEEGRRAVEESGYVGLADQDEKP
jgi:phosphate transport system substrate-binding protein